MEHIRINAKRRMNLKENHNMQMLKGVKLKGFENIPSEKAHKIDEKRAIHTAAQSIFSKSVVKDVIKELAKQ